MTTMLFCEQNTLGNIQNTSKAPLQELFSLHLQSSGFRFGIEVVITTSNTGCSSTPDGIANRAIALL